MKQLNEFLDTLKVRISVIEREDSNILDWYKQTSVHFINFFGVHGDTSVRFTNKMRDYQKRISHASVFERINIDSAERRNAANFINDVIIQYEPIANSNMSYLAPQLVKDLEAIAPLFGKGPATHYLHKQTPPKPSAISLNQIEPAAPNHKPEEPKKKDGWLHNPNPWLIGFVLVILSVILPKIFDKVFDTSVWPAIVSFFSFKIPISIIQIILVLIIGSIIGYGLNHWNTNRKILKRIKEQRD
jgi:hypothetical protein